MPACALALLPGCTAGGGESARAVAVLERMAFVPPGVSRIPGVIGVCATTESLLVDRFEVTRDDWRGWAGETGDAVRDTRVRAAAPPRAGEPAPEDPS